MSRESTSSRSSSSSCSWQLERLTLAEVEAFVTKLSLFTHPEVLNFELSSFSSKPLGYLGVHELLRVEARERDSGQPGRSLTFFVKSRCQSAIDFDFLIFREESKFFNEVLPELQAGANEADFWAAKCYLVTDNFMVLEDLRAKGLQAPGRSLEPRELTAALDCLGRYHASYIAWEERTGKKAEDVWPGYFSEKTFVPEDGGSGWQWLAAGIELIESIGCEMGLDAKLVRPAYDLAIEHCQRKGTRRNVLCHDDLWFNNFMFDEKLEQCRLVDFQMISYNCYAVDLAQIIYLNSRVEHRKKSEREMLETYHAAVKQGLKDCERKGREILGFEEMTRDYEENRICGLVAAAQFLPIALWSEKAAKKYSDPETSLHYTYTSRKDLVLEEMKSNEPYRCRIEEIVRDLLTYMEDMQNF